MLSYQAKVSSPSEHDKSSSLTSPALLLMDFEDTARVVMGRLSTLPLVPVFLLQNPDLRSTLKSSLLYVASVNQ